VGTHRTIGRLGKTGNDYVFNVNSPGGWIVNCRLLSVLRCFCSRLLSRAHILMINLEGGIKLPIQLLETKIILLGAAILPVREGMWSSCPMVVCSAGEAANEILREREQRKHRKFASSISTCSSSVQRTAPRSDHLEMAIMPAMEIVV
jgi:hypothetical protein